MIQGCRRACRIRRAWCWRTTCAGRSPRGWTAATPRARRVGCTVVMPAAFTSRRVAVTSSSDSGGRIEAAGRVRLELHGADLDVNAADVCGERRIGSIHRSPRDRIAAPHAVRLCPSHACRVALAVTSTCATSFGRRDFSLDRTEGAAIQRQVRRGKSRFDDRIARGAGES